MRNTNRSFWLYPLFQIPLIFLTAFLVTALLFWLLGWGRPLVSVAIILDLSESTGQIESRDYEREETVMGQEVLAVKDYIEKSASQLGRFPNELQVFGFGGGIKPLTSSFSSNPQQIELQLMQALQDPDLSSQIIPDQTDLNLAVGSGIDTLLDSNNPCRELLLVTDGQGSLSDFLIAESVESQIRINIVVVGDEAPDLRRASLATGGMYLLGALDTLGSLFTEDLFVDFNSNIKWVIFWLGLSWISFIWLLILPLDKWFFQSLLKFHWTLSGKLAIGNALLWTAATPGIVWRIAGGIPIVSAC